MLDAAGRECWRHRIATQQHSAATVCAGIVELVRCGGKRARPALQRRYRHPGSLSPRTGLLRGSNTVVPQRPAGQTDAGAATRARSAHRQRRQLFCAVGGRRRRRSRRQDRVRRDSRHWRRRRHRHRRQGAGRPARHRRRMGHKSAAAVAGRDELPAALGGRATVCYCGKPGCIETWLSGTGIQAHFADGSVHAADIVTRRRRRQAADACGASRTAWRAPLRPSSTCSTPT